MWHGRPANPPLPLWGGWERGATGAQVARVSRRHATGVQRGHFAIYSPPGKKYRGERRLSSVIEGGDTATAKGLAMLLKDRAQQLSPYLLSVLRIVLALLFVEHGSMKLFNFPASNEFTGLTLYSLEGVAGLIEFFGGMLMLFGFFTRPTAFVMSGLMACAYFIAHAPKSFFPALNMGEDADIYSFLFLYFAAAGAGPWSVDGMIRHERLVGREATLRHATAGPLTAGRV